MGLLSRQHKNACDPALHGGITCHIYTTPPGGEGICDCGFPLALLVQRLSAGWTLADAESAWANRGGVRES